MGSTPQTAVGSAATPPSTSRERIWRIEEVGGRELLIAWALLGLLGLVVFAPYARDGGFTLDDWSNGVGALQSGSFFDAISYFADLTSYRPVLVVYVPITYELFGMHMSLHIAWAATIGIAVSCLLFAILRTVGLPRPHAWLVSALVLVFPWFDSTRLWPTASQVTLGVALAFAGIWLALIAFRRRSLLLHAISLLLYATSILTYEIALPLLGAAGLLYVLLLGWRAAWRRWVADLVVVFAGAGWAASQTVREASGLDGNLRHLKDIVIMSGNLMGHAGLPVGPQRTTLVLLVLGAISLLGLALWLRDRSRSDGRPSPFARWLGLGAGGIAVAALGWVIFVPADPYYTPSIYGYTNRVNGLAGVGLVMIVYATCGIVGTLVGRLARQTRVATVATLALALAVGVGYLHAVDRHKQIWTDAFRAELAGIGLLKTALPDLPDGSFVFASGYPMFQTLGVPIFSTTWDLDGMVKLQYRNQTLGAAPLTSGVTISCAAEGAKLVGPGGYESNLVPYGLVHFVDVPTGRKAAPRTAAECRRAAPRFRPGPEYLSYDY